MNFCTRRFRENATCVAIMATAISARFCPRQEAGDPLQASVVRRLSLLAGPFAWLDWLPQLRGERQRLLDRLTKTKVIAQRGQGELRAMPGRPPAVL